MGELTIEGIEVWTTFNGVESETPERMGAERGQRERDAEEGS